MNYFSLRQSFRRDALDVFLEKNYHHVQGNVLDIGGQRSINRGSFDRSKLEQKSLNYTIINPEEKFKPDICCRFEDAIFDQFESYDSIVCTETFEYFSNPVAQLLEIDKLLKTDGVLILSIPFLLPSHSDSEADCFRLNPIWVERKLTSMGYILLQRQNTHLAHTFTDILRTEIHRNPPAYPIYKLLVLLLFVLKCFVWFITFLLPPKSSFTGGIWLWKKQK